MTADPMRKFQSWWREAEGSGNPLPEAMALATVDAQGRPSCRFVLLKGTDMRGFVFYTNERSRKGRELAGNPEAALAFYWHETGRQVRVAGHVSLVDDAEADAYWRTRPRGSQLASSVSEQSAEIESRRLLLAKLKVVERQLHDQMVPRPEHWRGYVLEPREIEFWTRKEPRLHEREHFERRGKLWQRRILQP